MNFAEVKRKLTVGTKLIVTYPDGKVLNREIIISRATQVVMIDPTKDDADERRKQGKGSWLEFPAASLVDIIDNDFSIYWPGYREMTVEEKAVYDGRPIDKEQSMNDAMTDGSTMFWREKKYFTDKGMTHLLGYVTGKAESVDHNKRTDDGYFMVRSNKVKGALCMTYTILE